MIFLERIARPKNRVLIITIVAPAGKSRKNEMVIPISMEMIEATQTISIAALKPMEA